MSSFKKTISINPSLFSMGGKRKNKTIKREKKLKPKSIISPNVMRKQLLEKVRTHQQNNKSEDTKDKYDQNLDHTLDATLSYLNELVKKRKQKDAKNYTLKNNVGLKNPSHSTVQDGSENVRLDLPPSLSPPSFSPSSLLPPSLSPPSFSPSSLSSPSLSSSSLSPSNPPIMTLKQNIVPDKPYGCLKNGNKPTYRSWVNSTRKNTISYTQPPIQQDVAKREENIQLPRELANHQISDREKKLEELKSSFSTPKQNTESNNMLIRNDSISNKNMKNTRKFLKRTIKKKYILGKSRKNKTISVLLKGRNMQNKVIREKNELQNKSISEMKMYLKKHGILRAGSIAPDSVIREMYMSSLLSGYISNHNKDILLHNFINVDVDE